MNVDNLHKGSMNQSNCRLFFKFGPMKNNHAGYVSPLKCLERKIVETPPEPAPYIWFSSAKGTKKDKGLSRIHHQQRPRSNLQQRPKANLQRPSAELGLSPSRLLQHELYSMPGSF